ncbi:MAG TPA: hypothetical protein VGE07_29635 [Herpetosiphonaceae bacterium]
MPQSVAELDIYEVIVLGDITEQSVAPDRLLALLQQQWPTTAVSTPTPVPHAIYAHAFASMDLGASFRWRQHADGQYLDGWLYPQQYWVRVVGPPALAIAFMRWYAPLVPAHYSVWALRHVLAVRRPRRGPGLYEVNRWQLTAASTDADLQWGLWRSAELRRAERLAAATYHLRVTKTGQRRWNKQLYRVERLEDGVPVNEALFTAAELGVRLLCERDVPLHTDIPRLWRACQERDELCFWIGAAPPP